MKTPDSNIRLNSSAHIRIVTTSWDDGDTSDMRIAELLRSRGLRGTFYFPIKCSPARETLASADLRALSSDGPFEVGAHTLSHKTMTRLSEPELVQEIVSCKQILESIIGSRVSMFCYPNGRYNGKVIQQLKATGYEGARTTRMLSLKSDFNPFEMPTTIQAFPHLRGNYLRNLGIAGNVVGLLKHAKLLSFFGGWVELGKLLFDRMLKHGGVWHLYGHSWEVDELGIWPELTTLLDYVSNRDGVVYATNSQLLQLVNSGRPSAQQGC